MQIPSADCSLFFSTCIFTCIELESAAIIEVFGILVILTIIRTGLHVLSE